MSETPTLELDDDGYPTEAAEQMVREFKGDPRDLLAVVKTAWAFGGWGWHEEDVCDEDSHDRPVRRYHVSTGGWSGNESLIAALEGNIMFWIMTWVQSRRGGHYVFEIPTPEGHP